MAARVEKKSPKREEKEEKEEKKGPIIPGFRVLKALGEGAYGTVYRVADEKTGAEYAAKVMQREQMGVGETEAAELSFQTYVRHPNIVPLLRVVETPQQIIIIMPLLGPSLDKEINKQVASNGYSRTNPNKAALIEERLGWMRQLLCGLQYMHARGFLHLDMKPPNVLLDSKRNALIADFGLVQPVFGHRHARSPNELVTSWYRAPELYCGDYRYGPAADYWSLATIFFFILFGRDAFPLDEAKIVERIRNVIGWPESFVTALNTATRIQDEERKTCLARAGGGATPQRSVRRMAESLLGTTEDIRFREYYDKHLPGLYDRLWGLIGAGLQVDPNIRATALNAAASALFGLHWREACSKRPIRPVLTIGAGFTSDVLESEFLELSRVLGLSKDTGILAANLAARLIAAGIPFEAIQEAGVPQLAVLSLASKHMSDYEVVKLFLRVRNQRPDRLTTKWRALKLDRLAARVGALEKEYLFHLDHTAWPYYFLDEQPLDEKTGYGLDPDFSYLEPATRMLGARILVALQRALAIPRLRELLVTSLGPDITATTTGEAKNLVRDAAYAAAAFRLGDVNVVNVRWKEELVSKGEQEAKATVAWLSKARTTVLLLLNQHPELLVSSAALPSSSSSSVSSASGGSSSGPKPTTPAKKVPSPSTRPTSCITSTGKYSFKCF